MPLFCIKSGERDRFSRFIIVKFLNLVNQPNNFLLRAAANRLHLQARELSFEHPPLRERLYLQAATPF